MDHPVSGRKSRGNRQSCCFGIDKILHHQGKRSTIITAQLPVSKWYEVIGEKTMADWLVFDNGIQAGQEFQRSLVQNQIVDISCFFI
jgi:hypothetical protein